MEGKEGAVAAVEAGQSLPALEVAEPASAVAKRGVQAVQEDSTRETDMVYDESNIHLQVNTSQLQDHRMLIRQKSLPNPLPISDDNGQSLSKFFVNSR